MSNSDTLNQPPPLPYRHTNQKVLIVKFARFNSPIKVCFSIPFSFTYFKGDVEMKTCMVWRLEMKFLVLCSKFEESWFWTWHFGRALCLFGFIGFLIVRICGTPLGDSMRSLIRPLQSENSPANATIASNPEMSREYVTNSMPLRMVKPGWTTNPARPKRRARKLTIEIKGMISKRANAVKDEDSTEHERLPVRDFPPQLLGWVGSLGFECFCWTLFHSTRENELNLFLCTFNQLFDCLSFSWTITYLKPFLRFALPGNHASPWKSTMQLLTR